MMFTAPERKSCTGTELQYDKSPTKTVGLERTLHFALGVDNHARIILEIDKGAILSPPGLSLSDDDRRHHWRHPTSSQQLFGCRGRCSQLQETHRHKVMISRCSESQIRANLYFQHLQDGSPFFLRSGLPFFTVAMTISPAAAAGKRFNRAPQPTTAMM